MTVFQQLLVLKEAQYIPEFFKEPDEQQTYDYSSHLWRWKDNGIPIIMEMHSKTKSRGSGENKIETQEDGMNKTDCFSLVSSNFGETVVTKTSVVYQ